MDSPSWFIEGRFGLFIHYGLYSGAARHEWVQAYEFLTAEEYQPYADHFDPGLFDAPAIARMAKNAGMAYAVLTTKHHEGFCLWNSELTDFNSQELCGRDLVGEFVAAMRAEGLHVGFYYSLIDWHHPDFTIDWNHPRRDDDDARAQNATRDMECYRQHLHGQLRELLTGYGAIDYLFFDFTYPEEKQGWSGKSAVDWDAEGLLRMCRELQPQAIINDRLGIPGDLVTPEQYQPSGPIEMDGSETRWEACQTTNGSWGYDRDNHNHKSADLLLRMLIDSVSKNGNLLLNVGPNGRGAIDCRDRALLEEIGEWMRLHRGSIMDAGASSYESPREGVYTQRGDKVFLHLFTWPLEFVHLPDLAGKVQYARLLHDGSWVKMSVMDSAQQAELMRSAGQVEGTLTLHLPVKRPDIAVPVVELTLSPIQVSRP